MVLFGHLVKMVQPSLVTAETYPAGTPVWQHALAASPLSVLWDGRLAVDIFFVLSGYVLTAAVTERRMTFPALATKRYIRLLLPVLAATLPALLLQPYGLYFHRDLGFVTGSAWLNSQTVIGFHPSILSWLYNGIWVVFFVDGETSFNSLLWTLRFEWYGSLLVFLLCCLLSDPRKRMPAAFLLGAILANLANYASLHLFCIGMILHDMVRIMPERKAGTGRSADLIGLALLGIGLYLPRLLMILIEAQGAAFSGLLWLRRSLPAWQGDRWMLAAICVVTAVVLSPSLKRLLSGSLCRFLGRISFPLYLFQLPLILSFGCWLMLTLLSRLGMVWAALLMFVVTALAALLMAWIMTVVLERPTLVVSARVGAATDALWLRLRAAARLSPRRVS
jgi:peptidoglycan/LPS O-acetylase OafA/YrhL